jgi:hypothetical protein
MNYMSTCTIIGWLIDISTLGGEPSQLIPSPSKWMTTTRGGNIFQCDSCCLPNHSIITLLLKKKVFICLYNLAQPTNINIVSRSISLDLMTKKSLSLMLN